MSDSGNSSDTSLAFEDVYGELPERKATKNDANKGQQIRRYTRADDLKIIQFIVKKGGENQVGGNRIWHSAEELCIVPGRSWCSLRDHYLHVILPKIDRYARFTNVNTIKRAALGSTNESDRRKTQTTTKHQDVKKAVSSSSHQAATSKVAAKEKVKPAAPSIPPVKQPKKTPGFDSIHVKLTSTRINVLEDAATAQGLSALVLDDSEATTDDEVLFVDQRQVQEQEQATTKPKPPSKPAYQAETKIQPVVSNPFEVADETEYEILNDTAAEFGVKTANQQREALKSAQIDQPAIVVDLDVEEAEDVKPPATYNRLVVRGKRLRSLTRPPHRCSFESEQRSLDAKIWAALRTARNQVRKLREPAEKKSLIDHSQTIPPPQQPQPQQQQLESAAQKTPPLIDEEEVISDTESDVSVLLGDYPSQIFVSND